MGDSGYKGISVSQDSRFKNKDQALLKSIKFPAHFDQKVDMKKVELEVMKPWIASRVTELLGFEDDVVLEYAAGMLEESRYPDAKKVQIQLTGFLEAQTAVFMSELWTLLLSAQESPGGIPAIFVQQKKEELRLKREKDTQAVREARERSQHAASGSYADRRRDDYRGPSQHLNDYTHQRGYNSQSRQSGFRDRSGQTTDRVRDSGWGPRSGESSRHPEDTRQRRDTARFDSRSQARRSRSLSHSPSPARSQRQDSRRRSRSRSRSVTPDYREEKRSRRSERTERDPRRPRSDRFSPTRSPEPRGDTTPKMDRPQRSHGRGQDSDDDARNRTPPSSSRPDKDRVNSRRGRHEESAREAELRAKLLNARKTQP